MLISFYLLGWYKPVDFDDGNYSEITDKERFRSDVVTIDDDDSDSPYVWWSCCRQPVGSKDCARKYHEPVSEDSEEEE